MRNAWVEQYKHPQWQRRRLEVMEGADFACQRCGDKESTLNVHHRHYIKGRKIWEYSDDELQCLCESCHENLHSIQDAMKEVMVNFDPGEVFNVLQGWLAGYEGTEEERLEAYRGQGALQRQVLVGLIVSELSAPIDHDDSRWLDAIRLMEAWGAREPVLAAMRGCHVPNRPKDGRQG